MSAKSWRQWMWRVESDRFVVGMYGRPWEFVVAAQTAFWPHASITFAAPILGDCHISWASDEWRRLSHSHLRGEKRWTWRRMSWALIDQIEAENAEREVRVKAMQAARDRRGER